MSDTTVQTLEAATASRFTIVDWLKSQSTRSTVFIFVPDPYLFRFVNELSDAAIFLRERLLDKYDLTGLEAIAVDEDECDGQFIYGSMRFGVYDTGDPCYIIHAAIPGPFPSMEKHEFGTLRLDSAAHACVWIVGHEFCHFLKRTAQLSGPNDEQSAVAFADDLLREFRTLPALSRK